MPAPQHIGISRTVSMSIAKHSEQPGGQASVKVDVLENATKRRSDRCMEAVATGMRDPSDRQLCLFLAHKPPL
jgi:hypothetical protein